MRRLPINIFVMLTESRAVGTSTRAEEGNQKRTCKP